MSTPFDPSPLPPADWEPAPPGTVGELARRVRTRRTRRRFLKAASGVAAGVVAAGGGLWVWRAATRPREYDYGGITCSEVKPRLERLLAGQLPEPEATRVRTHVGQCPNCGLRTEGRRVGNEGRPGGGRKP